MAKRKPKKVEETPPPESVEPVEMPAAPKKQKKAKAAKEPDVEVELPESLEEKPSPKKRKNAATGKSLVIVESPAKAKTINKILGNKFVVKACKGHVRDLPMRALGIDIEHDFEPSYKPIKGKKDVIEELKASSKAADRVYLAPDPDREGEAIAWHLVQALRIPAAKVSRVTFNEITKRGVLDAFNRPTEISMNRVNAQQARRVLDRIVGYKLSPLLWKKIGRGLSAGRVQSVAVRLIVEREREIRAFKAEEYWTIAATVAKKGVEQTFQADLSKIDGKEPVIGSAAVANGIVADAKKSDWIVTNVVQKERFDHPPQPFITSSLQQQSANRLHYSARRTMSIAQELYEGIDIGDEGQVGLITYMRTDSFRIADEAVVEVREHITKNFGPKYLPEKPPVPKKAGKAAQEAHEAIRPSSANRTPESIREFLTQDQFKLYRLVWRRFVASQMKAAEYLNTDVEIKVGAATFTAHGRELKFDGYTKLLSPWIRREEIVAMTKEGTDLRTILQRIKAGGLRPSPDALDELRRLAMADKPQGEDRTLYDSVTQSKDQILPSIALEDRLELKEVLPDQHFTEPPPRYTEASLVKTLEKFGIGRPSTYAPIISTIQDRGYVEAIDRRLHPKELGEIVTEKLVKHFTKIMDTGFTAKMEENLDEIEEGHRKYAEVMKEFYGTFIGDVDLAVINMESVKAVEPVPPVPCEKCTKPMLIKWNRYGKFLACSGYPECHSTKSLESPEAVGENCDKCQSPMLVKSGRFGRFLACSKYPDCKSTRPIQRGNRKLQVPKDFAQVCEKCAAKMIVRYGRRGPFIACSGYPECKNTQRVPKMWYVDAKKPEDGGAAAPPDDGGPEAPGETESDA